MSINQDCLILVNRFFVFFLLFTLFTSFTTAETYDYINPLTRSIADSLYCQQNKNCNISTLNAINVTEKTVNITGDMTIYGSLLSNGTITAEQLTSTDDATIQDDLTVYGDVNIGEDGRTGDRTATVWSENGYYGNLKFMEDSLYGFGIRYNATGNRFYFDRYPNSLTPTPMLQFFRDNGDYIFYSEGTFYDDMDVYGDIVANRPEADGSLRNPNIQDFNLQSCYSGLTGEGTGEDGMMGLYNGNELTNVGLFGNINVSITGAGSYTAGTENNLVNAQSNWFSINGVDETTEQVLITIDLGYNLPTYSSATWEPFLQYRTGIFEPPLTGNKATYFSHVKVENSADGITWATSSPASNWETTQFATDMQVPTYWFGTRDSSTAYGTTTRYVRFNLTDIQISPDYASRGSVWIAEIGFRARSAPFAPQFVQTAGDDIYGDLYLLDNTKLILNSSAEIYYNSNRLIIDDTDNQYIDFQDNNLTTTGKISTEHLYSTDDAVVQDDLTVLGSSGFGVTANNLYKTQVYSFNDNDNIMAQYIRTDSFLDNTEYYSTPIMKYHYDTQEIIAIPGLGQSIETFLELDNQVITGENQQENYDGYIYIHGKSSIQNIQIDIDTEDSDTTIVGNELTQIYGGLKGSGNLYFIGNRYNMQSNLGIDGITSKTGMSISVGGTADTNTALYLNVDESTSNKALNVNSGDIHLDSDTSKLCFGEGQDDCMLETGTGLVLDREVGIDTYPFNITGFSEVNIEGNATIGDGGLENYTEIKNNGEIILHGDARVYKEFIVPAGAIKAPGAKPATQTVLGILETPVWQFSNEILVANQESVSFSIKVPEDMDRTIDPVLLIGWSAPTYGNVKWGAEYLYRTLNEDVTISAQGSQNITVSSSSTSNGFVASSINSFATPDSNDLNIRFKLTRLSASAEDNLTDVVNLEGVVFRYVANKIGGTI